MAVCSFCGKHFPKATGKMYVKKEGTIFLFCSGKCEKNMLMLGRKPRDVGWTAEYHKVKQIERAGGIVPEAKKTEAKAAEPKKKEKDTKKALKKTKRREKRKKANKKK